MQTMIIVKSTTMHMTRIKSLNLKCSARDLSIYLMKLRNAFTPSEKGPSHLTFCTNGFYFSEN